MEDLNINYAHIGDAVYEVFVREKGHLFDCKFNKLHAYTVKFVNAGFRKSFWKKFQNF